MANIVSVIATESIPPIVPPATWTAWFSVDDPTDGTENETLAAVRSVSWFVVVFVVFCFFLVEVESFLFDRPRLCFTY